MQNDELLQCLAPPLAPLPISRVCIPPDGLSIMPQARQAGREKGTKRSEEVSYLADDTAGLPSDSAMQGRFEPMSHGFVQRSSPTF